MSSDKPVKKKKNGKDREKIPEKITQERRYILLSDVKQTIRYYFKSLSFILLYIF